MDDIDRLAQGMADVLTIGDKATIEAVFSPDYIEEYPQSGETIHGRSAILEMLASFPDGSKPIVRGEPRITRTDDGFVGEYLLDYGPQGLYHAVGFYAVRDGRIVHGKEYFAAPFEPAAWRTRWVESS
jgi:ketosteroid isomerase-like protein